MIFLFPGRDMDSFPAGYPTLPRRSNAPVPNISGDTFSVKPRTQANTRLVIMTGVIGRLVEYQAMLLLMVVTMMMIGGLWWWWWWWWWWSSWWRRWWRWRWRWRWRWYGGDDDDGDDDDDDDDGDDDDDDVDVDVCTSSFKGYLWQLIFPVIWHCTLVLDALDLSYMLHWCMLNALYTCDISIYKWDHS